MDNIAITLKIENKVKEDLVLPLDTPLYLLGDTIPEALGVNIPDNHRGRLAKKNNGRLLPIQKTLRSTGICNGQYLYLKFEKIVGKAVLKCAQGPDFIIKKDMVVIGCSYGNNLVDIDMTGIPNYEFVSGRHAKIFLEHEKFYIVDLKSRNGTELNEKPLEKAKIYELKDKDSILLGSKEESISLEFHLLNA